MAKTNWAGLYSLVIVALLIGGVVGVLAFPHEVQTVKTVTVTKEVPVDKIVNVEKLVEKNWQSYLDDAFNEFAKDFKKEDSWICGSQEFDSYKVRKLNDVWSINFNETGRQVNGAARLKYLDNAANERCYHDVSFSVFYENGEDPQVNWAA